MTSDARLAATITLTALLLAALYLAVCHQRYDGSRCGHVGGCPWQQPA